nr:HK97-gp10 family putative phage morphogenesis protein [Clostridium botulinum]
MELEGMDSLIRKLEDMGKAGTRVENKALKKAGQIIVDEAKNNVAVRTGKLKEGLKVSGVRKKGGHKFVLAGIQRGDNSKIFYGKFLEFGTSKMTSKPFMAPAYESKKDEAKEIIKQEIKNAIGL